MGVVAGAVINGSARPNSRHQEYPAASTGCGERKDRAATRSRWSPTVASFDAEDQVKAVAARSAGAHFARLSRRGGYDTRSIRPQFGAGHLVLGQSQLCLARCCLEFDPAETELRGNSEMSSQIIPLKGRTDLRESRQILATETIRL